MMLLPKILIAIILVFIALGLVSAVMVSRPREPRSGRRLDGPAGDRGLYGMPGFTPEQLEYYARRPIEAHHTSDGALLHRSAAGSGAVSSRPLPLPANLNARRLFNGPGPRPTFGRGRRAF
ncbi:hypothetical protein SAMN05216337_1001218 [Bradyrhizobium brasilense]|uniref:Uncharacterized protein n=1 Tax=Bradyrhizobium brasilense TaxID=1419277 RepID=A0A1G6IS60_9BRAD|nr:hypothetical protein [Bradyrhizobium brasilense]SDC08576.1 hypothetical protein SAMN05216337_1001218 [Bradyrhizobium brasilense]